MVKGQPKKSDFWNCKKKKLLYPKSNTSDLRRRKTISVSTASSVDET